LEIGDKFFYIKNRAIYKVIGIDIIVEDKTSLVLQDDKNALYIYNYLDFYNKFIPVANNIEYKKGA